MNAYSETNPAMFECLTTGTAYRKVNRISKPNSLLR